MPYRYNIVYIKYSVWNSTKEFFGLELLVLRLEPLQFKAPNVLNIYPIISLSHGSPEEERSVRESLLPRGRNGEEAALFLK